MFRCCIEEFKDEAIPTLLSLAREEGWISHPWEFRFLRTAFPQGALAARDGSGYVGFVTALRHGRSGWIGNLIVRKDRRGGGVGRALFEQALQLLTSRGVETIWLTASAQGRPLYEQQGFSSIDRIRRWQGSGSIRQAEQLPALRRMMELDAEAWGDRRDQLILATAGRGVLHGSSAGFLVCQDQGGIHQLGPWIAPAEEGGELFEAAIDGSQKGTLVVDMPERNKQGATLLMERGFRCCASTELMIYGVVPHYRPELIHGLATLGSLG
ncbi:MAG TPA: GNAT family N-acetyltransferase [Geobacterales bacterium]|nr:GNAT family N-acetyltransferase [Geobacterales bacterium]